MSDTPSNDDLSAIQRAIPDLVKQRNKQSDGKFPMMTAIIEKEMCRICGKRFNPKKLAAGAPRRCKDCTSRIESGETALVCIDGRFMFVRGDGDPQAKKLEGIVGPVTIETMNKLVKKEENKTPPEDLNKLVKIPDEDIMSGRHSMAECSGECGCVEPVRYRMTVEEAPFGESLYNTVYWCEKHKPSTEMPARQLPLSNT